MSAKRQKLLLEEPVETNSSEAVVTSAEKLGNDPNLAGDVSDNKCGRKAIESNLYSSESETDEKEGDENGEEEQT